ncbi:MAG: hypothetical protein ACRDH7_07565 [Actinomycetota bacterium]
MKPSEAVEILAFVRAVWHLPAPADPTDDFDLVVWATELADLTYEDAEAAVRRFQASSFAPTVLQVANVARAESYFRAARLALGPADGISFDEWLATEASGADKERVARMSPSLREKYGIAIGEVSA